MLNVLLGILLFLAVAGLGFLGFYAFQLRMKLTRLDGALADQQAKHDKEIEKWNEYSVTAKAQHKDLVSKQNEDARKWNEQAIALKTENQRLAKWKNVADADEKAAEIVGAARATMEKANSQAQTLLSTAQHRATSMKAETEQFVATELANAKILAAAIASEAKEKAKSQKDEAQSILNSATLQASKMIEAANKKAEEIAGSAFEAMKNASLYEKTVKAMKNLIDGYGNQYIIPE